MTIIVGYSDKSGTWLASDKRVTAGSVIEGTTQKVFVAADNLAFGVCGALRDLNVIKHVFRPPSLEFNVKKAEDCEAYLVTKFIPNLIETLDAQARISSDDADAGGFLMWGGNLLVAVGSHLFGIYNDFAMMPLGNYGAIGSGDAYARAVFSDMEKSTDMSGDEKCKRAITAASRFDTGCDSRVEIVKMR